MNLTHINADPKKSDIGESILCDSTYMYFKARENGAVVFRTMCLDGKTIEKNKNVIIIQVRVVPPLGWREGRRKGLLGCWQDSWPGWWDVNVCSMNHQAVRVVLCTFLNTLYIS